MAYDASTYSERKVKRVEVDPLALKPERGGKKNLKVAVVLLDDSDESRRASGKKQRLVIVGGGWGVSASSVLAGRDRDAQQLYESLSGGTELGSSDGS